MAKAKAKTKAKLGCFCCVCDSKYPSVKPELGFFFCCYTMLYVTHFANAALDLMDRIRGVQIQMQCDNHVDDRIEALRHGHSTGSVIGMYECAARHETYLKVGFSAARTDHTTSKALLQTRNWRNIQGGRKTYFYTPYNCNRCERLHSLHRVQYDMVQILYTKAGIQSQTSPSQASFVLLPSPPQANMRVKKKKTPTQCRWRVSSSEARTQEQRCWTRSSGKEIRALLEPGHFEAALHEN